ncbi:MAG TPA: hypothetical protein DDW94_05300 [Deltaproteobacteria bacterium]|nr:MAG: hypothetical protein A2Z79_04655 [Deltaproteobacteria bacterium GWA2_55_82]OGQ61971.1 MAG: hypothetical protein A3I81_13180 [Deltaproteobacteria bacterium RIFCSPLOWO2_02_FULL_55_12]OIJ74666.1 MAG: hypothetical protein A2V21_310565 [Deltaproteobacteria bacterium GWC2_55_46]HBG46390.1 hypothetical protein [Deltaproteobacteria bacterium]HCY10601.1 hypothetical protein [Deltaproteobacteria bacterium]
MAEPTYQWNDIAASQTDADSPIDTTLMEGIRQNLTHMKEWLGESFSPAKDHDHDGINSKSVLLADSVVTVAKLKMARGSFSASTGGDFYISISRYSHMPGLYKPTGNYAIQLFCDTHPSYTGGASDLYEVTARAQAGSNEIFYVYWDYHTN